ncbi:hypothetical protein PSUB009319_16250 [Ralstonia sp. SET104]|nr:hypothetical protein PSUB009319_16250 [Ralstonia sp. SET104]
MGATWATLMSTGSVTVALLPEVSVTSMVVLCTALMVARTRVGAAALCAEAASGKAAATKVTSAAVQTGKCRRVMGRGMKFAQTWARRASVGAYAHVLVRRQSRPGCVSVQAGSLFIRFA